jgi:hypothetical protein
MLLQTLGMRDLHLESHNGRSAQADNLDLGCLAVDLDVVKGCLAAVSRRERRPLRM